MSNLTAIKGGGDWWDASVDFVYVPDSIDLDEQHHQYREWLNNSDSYVRFPDWLIEHTDAEDASDQIKEWHSMT